MAPDANFESFSYNYFTVNDIFFNSQSKSDINYHIGIFSLKTKCFKLHETLKGLDCQNGFSVLHVIIRSINKGFEPFKQFYSTLNSMFSVICFLET